MLEESGDDLISILEIDIDGVEGVLFAENSENWIDRTDNIAIELHDDSSLGDVRGAFNSAISRVNFAVDHSGELTVCRRSRDTVGAAGSSRL